MGVVSIAEAWPAASRPFTVADLDRMPDDGRHEQAADISGDEAFAAERPFQVEIVPSRLVAGLLPD